MKDADVAMPTFESRFAATRRRYGSSTAATRRIGHDRFAAEDARHELRAFGRRARIAQLRALVDVRADHRRHAHLALRDAVLLPCRSRDRAWRTRGCMAWLCTAGTPFTRCRMLRVRVTGEVGVDRARRQALEETHGLHVWCRSCRTSCSSRRSVQRPPMCAMTMTASAPLRAQAAASLDRRLHRIGEVESRLDVGGHGHVRRVGSGEADDADARPADAHDRGRLGPGRRSCRWPSRPCSRRGTGTCASSRVALERAERILAALARNRLRTDRAEIELVVADGGGGVAHHVVAADHGLALEEVRLERALEHVAANRRAAPAPRSARAAPRRSVASTGSPPQSTPSPPPGGVST